MTQFLIENMAPIMFACLVAVLLLGYSVAFSLAAVGFVFYLTGVELGVLQFNLLGAIPDRFYQQMEN